MDVEFCLSAPALRYIGVPAILGRLKQEAYTHFSPGPSRKFGSRRSVTGSPVRIYEESLYRTRFAAPAAAETSMLSHQRMLLLQRSILSHPAVPPSVLANPPQVFARRDGCPVAVPV